ncbi:MAG: VIT and VWA domain-containing protein [Elusimicrobia bacterium]|nr:VIT and VWA domain-containing protein [Elusimicrobiota bacterium]
MKTLALTLGLILASLAPASAQQLVAWPMGSQNGLRMFLPGMPIRPLPPIFRPVPRPPHPTPTPVPQPQPLPQPEGTVMTFSGYRVDGTVADQTADLSFDITFHNPTQQRLEGVLLIPIPADTVLSGFTMTVNGHKMNGELLESDKASAIYQGIVNRMRDPALLELVGERLLRAKVFPIEPSGDISVHIGLTQLLHKSGELVSLNIPVKSARMLQGQAGRASVRLKLSTTAPLRTLYTPLSGAQIRRIGDRQAEVSYEESSQHPAADLDLFFSMRSDPLAASLLAYKEDGEDGFFMLNLSPRLQAQGAATPKDIVFVLDRSGSMEDDGKMGQARKALSYCIGRLSAEDRFAVVDFATDANTFATGLVAASAANKARAKRYVEGISAAGSTNIEGALEETFKFLRRGEGRLPMVFFITDGLPTVGATDVNELLRRAHERNASLNARLFAFGVGSDVNTLLLDKLAADNRGSRDYVAPGEDIEGKVSGLYQKVAKPALTDVRVDWQGLEVKELYPRPVTDLFYGSELVLMGRYRDHGKGSLVVTGRMAGRAARFVFPVELPATADRAFLPKLWAGMKVAHELDAMRLSGAADQETIASIVKLAKKYGIVTPYTSYLIAEEGQNMPAIQAAAVSAVRGMALDAASSGFSGGAGVARKAQSASRFLGALSGSSMAMISGAAAAPMDMMAEQEAAVRQDMGRQGSRATQTRTIAGKTFYKRGQTWVDGDYELREGAAPKTVRVVYLSPEYFDLLSRKPALARYLALGSSLKVMDGDTLYEVAPQ